MKNKTETAKQIRRKVIRAATTEHNEMKRRLQAARAVPMHLFEQVEAILTTAKSCGLNISRHWVAYASYNNGLQLHMNAPADSLKSGPVMAMVGFLDGLLGAKSSRDFVAEEYAERNYNFGSLDEGSLQVHLEIDVSDAATCRRVKVGEKMEMVAQYEIQCNE
jgi:hypothetical protein